MNYDTVGTNKTGHFYNRYICHCDIIMFCDTGAHGIGMSGVSITPLVILKYHNFTLNY